MAAQNPSRKRAAPGADPAGYSQQLPQMNGVYGNGGGSTNNNGLGQLSDDQFFEWGQAGQPQNPYQDPSMFDGLPIQPTYPSNNVQLTNQIARRPANQIATRLSANGGHWLPDSTPAKPAGDSPAWEDDVDGLEEKAQVAKKEAQTKRKPIPPFVLKLRSFLDDGKNGDLIRWTDDGRSFVVLDEDEFAKKLIPELFKHNNYASFVRQLNMYGFHKKVGLSDNSMRASERKSKSPSEYSNPYFRQGHYDLMWLIQKPKNAPTTAKGKGRTKQEGDTAEVGDEMPEEVPAEPRARPRPQLTLPDASNNSLSTEVLQNVQRELVTLRHQHSQMKQIMTSMRRDNEQLYSQAATFQSQHDRHEKSINAILTFLATIYNKGGLPSQETTNGIANFFNGTTPQNSTGGNVVDVGDYNFDQFSDLNNVNSNRPLKKQPLLLTDGQPRAQTMSPASTNSPYMRNARRPSHMKTSQSPDGGLIEEIPEFGPSPTNSGPQSSMMNDQHQQDMMSVIQNANARNANAGAPVADFTNALQDLERSRGSTPLSNAQRENVLRMINDSTNQTGDNALVNATPPPGPDNFNRRLASNAAGLDVLAKMQAQQDQSVQNLTNLLQPLSPSGSIPGIGDGQNLPPPPIDIEDLFPNDYFADLPSDGQGNYDLNGNEATLPDPGFTWNTNDDNDELFGDVDTGNGGDFSSQNYGFDLSDANQNGGGRVESVASSEVTTPKHSYAGSEMGDETVASGGPSTRSKGRKLSTVEENGAQKRRRKS